MPRSMTRRDVSQRGYTITEVLVATAIFAIIFVAALLIYDRANKVFKQGVESSDMQQNARVAYDRLVADLRMAGFDHDRDGVPVSAGSNVWQATTAYGPGSTVSPSAYNGFTYRVTPTGAGTSSGTEPTWNTSIGGTTNDGTVTWLTLEGVNSFQQVDEQIEYAGTHAVTIRANFDHDLDKANDYGRESTLESVPFPVVTTGNDEIVTYALVSEAKNPDGTPLAGINPDTITFFADLPDRRTYPGGRSENPVNISDVDLCTGGCNSPPYTLVRFTQNPAGAVQRTPIATNIRSLDLTYYADVNGTTPLTIADAGGGQYNPITPATSADQRAARAGIRAIRIELVAMNEAPDFSYRNPDEAGTLAERYRTYRVESLIVPRNLGKQGMREQPSAPPGKPRMARVCINACRMAYVEWLAPAENPDQGLTEQYGITYDTTPAKTKIKLVGAVTSAYVENLTPGLNYYFSVSAINGFGSTPADDPAINTDDTHTIFVPGSATAGAGFNETTSENATNLIASGGTVVTVGEQPNQITLGWTLPTLNVAGNETLSCFEPGGGGAAVTKGIAPGEIVEWEVRRGTTADFNPVGATIVPTGAPNTISMGLTAATLVDKTAATCVDYYYRVRSKEACPGSWTQGGASNTSAWFPPYDASPNAIRGRASAVAEPTAPISLLGTESCVAGTDYDAATEVCNYLVWPKVKTDAATPIANEVLIDTYQLEITRYRKPPGVGSAYSLDGVITDPSGTVFVPDPNGTNWLRKDTDPTTGVLYTSTAGNRLLAVHPSTDNMGATDTFAYEYRIRALQCPGVASPVLPADYTLASDLSPAFRFPCEGSGTSTVDVTDYLDGDGTSIGSAFLVQNGLSTVVVDGTDIDSVQVYLTDLQNTTIANLGTLTAAPYIFPIDGTEDGQIYRVFALVKDIKGCTNVSTVFIEEATPSGCCLAAAATDPFVVQYTAGRRQFDVFFRNGCEANLQIQTLGIKIEWDPSLTATGTVLESVVFPGGAVAIVNDTTGSVMISVPAGGLTTIGPQAENYSVQLVFNQALTVANVTGPLTGFCVTYRRTLPDGTVLDIEDQNCKIVPQPAIFNSCSS